MNQHKDRNFTFQDSRLCLSPEKFAPPGSGLHLSKA